LLQVKHERWHGRSLGRLCHWTSKREGRTPIK
jgi:hypothetical protein